MLAQALEQAQHAVHLDTARSDLPAAIAAYDEAIALLQRVVARRARKPGTEAEIERVTDIVSPPAWATLRFPVREAVAHFFCLPFCSVLFLFACAFLFFSFCLLA